jgi:hypothetical protein
MLGILKLAVAISLLAPSPEPGRAVATFVRNELKYLGFHYQVIDSKAGDLWFRPTDDCLLELEYLRWRLIELQDAPSIAAANLFLVDYWTAAEFVRFNENYAARVEQQFSFYPREHLRAVVMREIAAAAEVWNQVAVIKNPDTGVKLVRTSLKKLKSLIGEDNFNRGL